MKRNQCFHSATKLTENDARIIARFRHELELHSTLTKDGHTHDCARLQIWDERACTCIEREADR